MADFKSDLNLKREGEKFILTDVTEYTTKGLQDLYMTFKATMELKEEQFQRISSQKNMVEQEIAITKGRFEQIKSYMEKEGITFPDQVVEEPKENEKVE